MEELTVSDTPTTNGKVTEIIIAAEVVEEPCEPCQESFTLDSFKDWSDHDLFAAILAELIMMRRTMTDLGEGLSAIGNAGLGSLFKGMFGGS